MDYRTLTAPCGIDCFNCDMHTDNITTGMQQYLAQVMKVAPETIGCQGCRVSGCMMIPGQCETRECSADRGMEFCSDCPEFPCARLQPCVDGAEKYPHNMKVFNLCRIKAVGLKTWAREEAREIRTRYTSGKLQVGVGPVLQEDQ